MSRPLRIGIACYPTYGGSGVLATELGIALADRGHEVHLFSYARPTRLSRYQRGIEFHGVRVSSYPLFRYPPYDLALTSLLRQVICDRRLDVVHVHYAVPHALCAYMAREMLDSCTTRIVTTLHGTDITILGRDPSYRDVIRFGLSHSDAVIAVSRWLADQTREVFEHRGPIEVVPNFVDHDRFHPRDDDVVRRELGGNGQKLIVHVSNFRALKRATDAVEVLARLDPALEARLVLAGDGPDLPTVLERAADRGLSDRVVSLGEIQDIETILAASDVALFPSESESFGLSALEAMACAVPVVSSNVGGVPEVVIDGETGFLHDVGDVDGMAASVSRLLRDADLAQRMAAAGSERSRTSFALDGIVARHEDLYRRLIDDEP